MTDLVRASTLILGLPTGLGKTYLAGAKCARGGLLSVKRMVEETYGFAQNLDVRVKKPLRARRRK